MTSTDLARETEDRLIDMAEVWTSPDDRECVFCYVARMIAAFDCDTTLRWASRWRDRRLPRATGLEKRLGRRGGFCDCEIFLNGWTLGPAAARYSKAATRPVGPEVLPPCLEVSPRSSQPCGHWIPISRHS